MNSKYSPKDLGLFREEEAAQLLGLPRNALSMWRNYRVGPRYICYLNKLYYREQDIMKWVENHIVTPCDDHDWDTSEHPCFHRRYCDLLNQRTADVGDEGDDYEVDEGEEEPFRNDKPSFADRSPDSDEVIS